jgi:hypothetical protein
MSLFGPTFKLRGDYSGYRDAGIKYKFRFCHDGTYYYLAEISGLWRLAHRGVFQIRETKNKSNPACGQTIALDPRSLDIIPDDPNAVHELRTRALPTDRREEYRVSTISKGELVYIYFAVPDPDHPGFSVSWHLTPMS